MPGTTLGPAASRWLALAICTVLLAGGTTAQAAAPAGPHPADEVVRAEDDRKRDARSNASTARERERRRESRRAFAGLSRAEALNLAEQRHPAQVLVPALRSPSLPPGHRIAGYEGDFSARLSGPDGTDDQLVVSNVPLRAEDQSGRKRPVDLSVVRSGAGFRPANPLSDVRFASRLADGLSIPGASLVVRPVGAGKHADPILSGDTIFYADAFTDSDLLVRPTPDGFSVHLQLRSEDSPERFALALDVPDGVVLAPVEGGIEVRRDGETLGVVTAPVAWDADGSPVETAWRLDGGRLEIEAKHRGLDLAYPLLVDPDVVETFEWERYGANNQYGNFAGWNWRSSGAFANHGWNGNSTWLGNGLYIRNLGTTYWYNAGDSGVWWWRAPGFARIKSVEWNLFDQDAVEGTCMELGIAKWPPNQPGPVAWQSGNPSWARCDRYWNQYARSWNAGEPGDEAEFKVQAAPDGGYRTYFAAQVGVVYLYLNDSDHPSLGSGLPDTWVNWASTKTLDVWAIDPSTGISSLTLSAPGWSGATIGPEVYTRCARTYMCPRGHATDGTTRNATVGNMPEGINTISVTARDPSGNQRTSAETGQSTGQGLRAGYYNNWDFTSLALVRVDPTVDFNWGTAQPHPAISADTYTVRWTGQIEAPTTGSYQFQTSTDDGVRLWVHDINTPKIDDWRSHGETARTSGTMSLTAGKKYRVVMEYFEDTGGAVARLRWKTPGASSFVTIPSDRLTPPGGWQLRLDRTAPQLELSGPAREQDVNSGEVLGNDHYDLGIDATDGTETTQRAGVRSLEVFVAGVSRERVEEPCESGYSCPLDHDWDLNIYEYTEGRHTIRVDATDYAGNVATESWQVDIDHDTEDADSEGQAQQTQQQQRMAAHSPTYTGAAYPAGVTHLGLPAPGCNAHNPEVGVRSDITQIISKARETTVFFAGGSYRVSRCLTDGTLQISMRVGAIPVPGGGSANVPLDYKERVVAGRYKTVIPEYGRPESPKWSAMWNAGAAQATGMVIPSTTLP